MNDVLTNRRIMRLEQRAKILYVMLAVLFVCDVIGFLT